MGAGYLPLDPEYPESRLQFMVEDSGASLLLIQAHYAAVFAETTAQKVDLEAIPDALAACDSAPLAPVATANDLVYVIYTSGSTGTPKGVAMHYRPLANLIEWQIDQSTLGAGARPAVLADEFRRLLP